MVVWPPTPPMPPFLPPLPLPLPMPPLFAMCRLRAATKVNLDETVSAIFCMAYFISANWTSTVLLLLWLLIPESVLASAVSVGGIDTVRPCFSSSVIFLS